MPNNRPGDHKGRPYILLALFALGCTEPRICESGSRVVLPAHLPGRYAIHFDTVQGSLALDSSGGSLDVDPAALGVSVAGNPHDVRAVITTVTGSPSVILRVGSIPTDESLFDGSYFSLFVERIDERGMQGSWRGTSATPMVSEASGRFCATRMR